MQVWPGGLWGTKIVHGDPPSSISFELRNLGGSLQIKGPLRSGPFVVVVGGEGLSMLGDGAFSVALAWLVIQETGSVSALASVLLVQAIPRGLLALFGGAVTDRLSPRTVMLGTHLVRGVAVAAVAILAWAGSSPHRPDGYRPEARCGAGQGPSLRDRSGRPSLETPLFLGHSPRRTRSSPLLGF